MSTRVYLLLDVLEEKFAYAIQTLQNAEGVVAADTLEGHPNIIVIIEAQDRQKLAELMMPVLRSLDHIITDLHLLMTRRESLAPCFFGARNLKSYIEQIMN